MISPEYVRTLEAEVCRQNRRAMWPVWLVAGSMLIGGIVAWVELTFPMRPAVFVLEAR